MIRQWFGNATGRLYAGLFLLLLNTAYLAAFAEPTLVYYANVVAHIALGAAVAAGFARRLVARRAALPLVLVAASVVLAAGTLFGVAIAIAGAAGRVPWLFPGPGALVVAGPVPRLPPCARARAPRLP